MDWMAESISVAETPPDELLFTCKNQARKKHQI